jgi:hypothetical protein
MSAIGPDVCRESALKKIFGKSSYDRIKCGRYFSRLSDIITEQVGPHTSDRNLTPGQSMQYHIFRSRVWCVSKQYASGERVYARIKLDLVSEREDSKTYVMLYTNEGRIGNDVKRVISEGVFRHHLNFFEMQPSPHA